MARTKQTARKSTGGKAPRKTLASRRNPSSTVFPVAAHSKQLKRKRAELEHSDENAKRQRLITEPEATSKASKEPFPVDVLLSTLFSFLQGVEIAKCSRVCKEWHQLIWNEQNDENLWRKLVTRTFGFEPVESSLTAPSRKWFNFYFVRYMNTRGKYAVKLAPFGLKLTDITSTMDFRLEGIPIEDVAITTPKSATLPNLGSPQEIGFKISPVLYDRLIGATDISKGVYVEDRQAGTVGPGENTIIVDCLNGIVLEGTAGANYFGDTVDSNHDPNIHVFSKVDSVCIEEGSDHSFILEITNADKFKESLEKRFSPENKEIKQSWFDSQFAIGESKAGNLPDLPQHFPWPMDATEGKKMEFVAQFNVSEMKLADLGDYLPNDGMIWCFAPPYNINDDDTFTEDSMTQPKIVIHLSNKQIRELGGLVRKKPADYGLYQWNTDFQPTKFKFSTPVLPDYADLPEYVQAKITEAQYQSEIRCDVSSNYRRANQIFGRSNINWNRSVLNNSIHERRKNKHLVYPKPNGKGAFVQLDVADTPQSTTLDKIIMDALRLKSGKADHSKIYLPLSKQDFFNTTGRRLAVVADYHIFEDEDAKQVMVNNDKETEQYFEFMQVQPEQKTLRKGDQHILYEVDNENECTLEVQEDAFRYASGYSTIFNAERNGNDVYESLSFVVPNLSIERKSFAGAVVIGQR